MNPAPFTDSELLSKFEEYLLYLNTQNYPENKERTVIEFNQICSEIEDRKWTIKKRRNENEV
jgi:hypothetical protein